MASVAELLSAARRRSFVGREREIEIFERLLDAPAPDCVLLNVYGPGGQGKTTLVKHCIDLCGKRKIGHALIDAREVEPHPAAFMEAVRASLGKSVAAGQDVFEALNELPGKAVVFIDTYEKINLIND